jgi:GNAT superfamily N-acetyltransferase
MMGGWAIKVSLRTCTVCSPAMPNIMRHISISFDFLTVPPSSIAALFESVGFGTKDNYLEIPNFEKLMFGQGSFGVFAVDAGSNQLAGLIRVFSDNIFTTYIAEVCVHPSYQRFGIGDSLVKAITTRFGHTAIFSTAFRETHGVFEKNEITQKGKLVACSRGPRPFRKTYIQ